MKIKTADFIKGLVGDDDLLANGIPQIAFIGRSNVGKSSVINTLVNRPIAKSSSKPGKTTEINLFLINKAFYLVDLPGYGYAKASLEDRDNLRKLIYWYLLYSDVDHKNVVVIVDAKVGMTENDKEIIRRLKDREKRIIIVANKVDRLKKSEYKKSLAEIQTLAGDSKVIPFSTVDKIGVGELTDAMLK